jgi:hypothetical protein
MMGYKNESYADSPICGVPFVPIYQSPISWMDTGVVMGANDDGRICLCLIGRISDLL